MSVKKLYDLAVKVSSYQNAQGEQKNRYQNVGALMQGDNGKFLFLEKWFNPAGIESQQGSSSIIVSMFEPRPKDGQQQNQPQQAPQQQNNQQYAPQQNNQQYAPQQNNQSNQMHNNDEFSDDSEIPF